LDTLKMIEAWSYVVAALITWAPSSGSQHRQYNKMAEASVDFAFLRATANSADVNRRGWNSPYPSMCMASRLRKPKSCTTKNTCDGCRTMVGLSHLPSTCGSFSMKSHASLACHSSKKNGQVFFLARF